ncbi:DNA endonuclease SmrA [Shimwellia pseudoproteus]|uniref:DNA endonuclease SmrA n=1 Tax=Shimwellia pseudoproteus TaxID=570012 RepID=UPI0018EC67C6|nr:DNA endonuclease SmrA [Shimwellia pseudoproteus]MBJ3816169.1 DNA endonuclease SmrA [Shimwellia pseudoproteus]
MNSEEKDIFLAAVSDVKQLKDVATTRWNPQPKSREPRNTDLTQLDNVLTLGFLDIVPLSQPLEYHLEGVQPGVLEKLRLGKYPQQGSLNLIRQPVEQCRQQLFVFIRQAVRDGLRSLLIVHGKGKQDDSHANIVRSYLARWLKEFDDIQAYCQAPSHQGGSGACYVMLKKSARIKLDNRERHARRSR